MFHIHGFNQLQVWKYYREKISEISKNQKLILPCTGNYLHGICIVFTAICITFTLYWVLEVIVGWFNIYGMVYLYIIQILQPCYIKDLSICGFWCSLWIWNQSPTDTKGHRVYCCDLKQERSFISWKLYRRFISCVV